MNRATAVLILFFMAFGVMGLSLNNSMDLMRSIQNMQHLRMLEIEKILE